MWLCRCLFWGGGGRTIPPPLSTLGLRIFTPTPPPSFTLPTASASTCRQSATI